MSTKKMTIRDCLRGCTVGRMQTVGVMQMLPLLSEVQDDRFVSPEQAAKFSTSNYGCMDFQNRDDSRPMIVPMNAAYVVDQAAQNHAMSHAGLVKAKAQRRFDTACCIQQSQGGLISRGEHNMMILPHVLREAALGVRQKKQYGKLWPSITKFNEMYGITGRSGHLELFLNLFKEELDTFVAQFETVPNQVGAIVLINGVVVGVERTSSTEYWESIWPALVRECYGSLAMYTAEHGSADLKPGRSLLKCRARSVAGLKKALADARKKDEGDAKDIVRGLIDDEFSVTKEDSMSVTVKDGKLTLNLDTVDHQQFLGQVVRDGDRVVYASCVAKSAWVRNSDWHQAPAFDV